jgi:hypothetical protein
VLSQLFGHAQLPVATPVWLLTNACRKSSPTCLPQVKSFYAPPAPQQVFEMRLSDLWKLCSFCNLFHLISLCCKHAQPLQYLPLRMRPDHHNCVCSQQPSCDYSVTATTEVLAEMESLNALLSSSYDFKAEHQQYVQNRFLTSLQQHPPGGGQRKLMLCSGVSGPGLEPLYTHGYTGNAASGLLDCTEEEQAELFSAGFKRLVLQSLTVKVICCGVPWCERR